MAFAAISLSGGALAADLPLKAPPKAVDFNPFWAEADYLAWSVSGDKLPALVTTAPVGTPLGVAGVLGQPTTTRAVRQFQRQQGLAFGWTDHGRLLVRSAAQPWHRGLVLRAGEFGTGFAANTGTTPILMRPFLNVATGVQDALIAGFPGIATGSVNANETSRLLGAGALYRQDLGVWGGQPRQRADRLSLSAVVRHAVDHRYREQRRLRHVHPHRQFQGREQFPRPRSRPDRRLANGPWSLEWRGKVALGANLNTADISGSTTTIAGASPRPPPGGFLASPSNIGHFEQTRFAAVPEISLKAGYQVAPAGG